VPTSLALSEARELAPVTSRPFGRNSAIQVLGGQVYLQHTNGRKFAACSGSRGASARGSTNTP
jgi:hypothetical protein